MCISNGHVVVASFDRIDLAFDFHSFLCWHHKDLNPTMSTKCVTVSCPSHGVFSAIKDKALGMGAEIE